MQPRTARPALAALVAVSAATILLPACGDTKEADNQPARARLIERDPANGARPELVIGSKGFTEPLILAQIYGQALTAAGYAVRHAAPVPGERAALAALQAGELDLYPEYTGTVLTTLFGERPANLPKDPRSAYEQARADLAAEGLAALPPTPFSNSNGFAMRAEDAANLGVTTLTELARHARDLVLAGPRDCPDRADCLRGLEREYGARFKAFRPVPVTARHRPLREDEADVAVVFTTDGQIRTENLALLADDRRMLPPYNVTLIARRPILRAAGPDLPRVVAAVQRGLTTTVMQELNSRVELDGETPEAVAHGYLREVGYVE